MTKNKYTFLIDSSASQQVFNMKNVNVLPVEIIVEQNGEEKAFKDNIEISREEVENYIKKDVDLKSSQTPYGVISEKLVELLTKNEKVICLTISKNLSGLYNSYCSIKKELEKDPEYKNRILVVDTLSLGIQQDFLIEDITDFLERGLTFAEIEQKIKEINKKYCGVTAITNATRLKKGGRLTGIKALLVRALNIKLLIKWQNGALTFVDKKSNLEDSVDRMWEIITQELSIPKNKIRRLIVFSELDKTTTEKLNKRLLDQIKQPNIKIIESKFPTCVILHLGIGSYSILAQIE